MSDRAKRIIREPAARWVAPDMVGVVGSQLPGVMTASKRDALQQAAYDEAFAQGLEEGQLAGSEKLASQAERLNKLVEYLGEPLRQLDDDVEHALVELAILVARQIIRRELAIDPAQIVSVLRDAIGVLPINSRDVAVHLHPEDAAVVREVYGESSTGFAWNLVEDPVLSRGGLRVTTETSQVDARVDSRLGAILATLVDREWGDDG